MTMLEIAPLSNGAHRNQTAINPIPSGWAIIPDDMETPNFPFGDVETVIIDGVLTVSKWIPGTMPTPEPEPPKPSQLDRIEAQVTYTAMMTDTLIEED